MQRIPKEHVDESSISVRLVAFINSSICNYLKPTDTVEKGKVNHSIKNVEISKVNLSLDF